MRAWENFRFAKETYCSTHIFLFFFSGSSLTLQIIAGLLALKEIGVNR